MRCAACGQLVLEGTKYCPSCGAKIDEQAAARVTDDAAFQDAGSSGQPLNNVFPQEERAYTIYEHNDAHQPAMPMKWYKFLIYVSLVLTCIYNVLAGVQIIMGLQYDADTAAQIYSRYAGLRIVDIIYGIAIVAFGLFAFVVRQKLAHYRKDGPKYLLIMYVASVVLSMAYLIVVMLITGVNMLNSSVIANLAVAVVMTAVNKIYFDKRMHLFTE